MDTLPLELLERVFSEACCDAGQTACSLRLLCKSACALVEPFRFRSVAVSGYEQMGRFLQAYRASACSATSGSAILHLFVVVKLEAGESCIVLCLLWSPRTTHIQHVSFAWNPLLATAHQGVSLFIARACSSKLTHICVSGVSLDGGSGFAALRTILQLTPKESWDSVQDIEPLPPTIAQYTLGVNTKVLSLMPSTAEQMLRKAEAVRVEAAERGRTALVLTTYQSGETWEEEEKQTWIRSWSNDTEDDAECTRDAVARLESWMTVLRSCCKAP